jgi:hypothetical protein
VEFASVDAIDIAARNSGGATKPGLEFLGGLLPNADRAILKNAGRMKRCWLGRHHLLSCSKKMRAVRMPLP